MGRRRPPKNRDERRFLPAYVLAIIVAAITLAAAQARVPDAATVASIRAEIQSGRIAQAREQLRQFDAASPIVTYLEGLALYHADDHAKAIETLMPIVTRLDAGSLERREAELA